MAWTRNGGAAPAPTYKLLFHPRLRTAIVNNTSQTLLNFFPSLYLAALFILLQTSASQPSSKLFLQQSQHALKPPITTNRFSPPNPAPKPRAHLKIIISYVAAALFVRLDVSSVICPLAKSNHFTTNRPLTQRRAEKVSEEDSTAPPVPAHISRT
jgi:hypothetical protein